MVRVLVQVLVQVRVQVLVQVRVQVLVQVRVQVLVQVQVRVRVLVQVRVLNHPHPPPFPNWGISDAPGRVHHGLLAEGSIPSRPIMSPSPNEVGNRLEGIAQRCLERDGFKVFRVRRNPIRRADGSWFSPKVDLGGGDLLAWKLGERVRIIQVTADHGVAERVETFMAAGWPPEHVVCELWTSQAIAPGEGISHAAWAYSQHFRVRLSDDDFQLVRDRLVFFDATIPDKPARQGTLRGLKF